MSGRNNLPGFGAPTTQNVVSYAPTITQVGNTFSNSTAGFQRIAGNLIVVWGFFTSTSAITAALNIALPAGYVVGDAFGTASNFGVGSLGNSAATAGTVNLYSFQGSSTIAAFAAMGAATSYNYHAIVPVRGV